MADEHEHPLDGKPVSAMTYADDDRELPARAVSGTLEANWLDGFERFQCFVDGELVNPATVKGDGDDNEDEPVRRALDAHGNEHAPAGSSEGGRFVGQGGGGSSGSKKDGQYDRKPGAEYDRKPPREGPPPLPAEALDALHAALPADAQKPSAWEKAKKAFGVAYDAAFVAATELGMKMSHYAPDVLDTAEDYSKISYARYTGTSTTAHDPFAEHLGIGANSAAVVISHAVAHAATFARKKAGTAKADVGGLSVEDMAQGVADVLNAVHQALGVELRIDPADVLAWLQERESARG